MNSTDPRFIGWLNDPRAGDPAYSGGKGASLAALTRAGLPVPAGFVVSTAAYQDFVFEHALAPLITQVTGHLDTSAGSLDAASAGLREGSGARLAARSTHDGLRRARPGTGGSALLGHG